jgi:hypothetical protein
MPVVGPAGEPRVKQLDTLRRPAAVDPALVRAPARSFKTFAAGPGFMKTHRWR